MAGVIDINRAMAATRRTGTPEFTGGRKFKGGRGEGMAVKTTPLDFAATGISICTHLVAAARIALQRFG